MTTQQYLEYSEQHQRLNPYAMISSPIMHFGYRRAKEQRRFFLEEYGFDSKSKAVGSISSFLENMAEGPKLSNDMGFCSLTQI